MLKFVIVFIYFLNKFTCDGLLVYPDYKNHTCKRTCVKGVTKVCEYEFTYEWMYTNSPDCLRCATGTVADCSRPTCMVADGRSRMVNTFNRMLPGPQIEVCQGDTVVVTIVNHLEDVSTTVHWHGQHQRDTPWMDGVPFITQCPILPMTSFRYRFIATEAGTHWYHSHSAFQRTNGAYGHLIVKQPPIANPHSDLYDFDLSEHAISITEFSEELSQVHYFRVQRMKRIDQFLTTILVNGTGSSTNNTVPPAKFSVTKGMKYRFRLIHAGVLVCPIEVKIDGHRMTIISTDGYDVQPVTVDTIYINNGERVDFVLAATGSSKLFNMRFQGTIDCERVRGRASLEYSTGTGTAPQINNTNAVRLNCINMPSNTANCVFYPNMESVTTMPANMKTALPAFKYFFGSDTIDYAIPDFQGVNDSELTTTKVNNISFAYPSTPMLQSIANTTTCNYENRQSCTTVVPLCQCTHMISIPLNAVTEFILVDEASTYPLSHPFHLHGYGFWVIGQGRIGSSVTTQQIRQLDAQGQLQRNFNNPPIKDTVTIPAGGYVIIRFQATNPGMWFFHCHVEHHAEEGMGLVLRVGTPPTLPTNFPRCGDYWG